MCKPANGPSDSNGHRAMVPRELKLVAAVAGLYSSFLVWGVLQERITSVSYRSSDGLIEGQWAYPVFLNACMAVASLLVSIVVLLITGLPKTPQPPSLAFWKPALSCSLASPFGYAALQYISYPLLLLSKSCKLVPVMIMGRLLRGVRYRRGEYLAVALITAGVVLFSVKPSDVHGKGAKGGSSKAGSGSGSDGSGVKELIGLGLVLVNLLLDGVTNSLQDGINATGDVSSFYMMLQINLWMSFFHALGLLVGAALFGGTSELFTALSFCHAFPAVVPNIALFCVCAATGQLFIFYIIKNHGSLVNVTCTITRKCFSILVSVALFGHPMAWWQWLGFLAVFLGLSASVADKYRGKKDARRKKHDDDVGDGVVVAAAAAQKNAGSVVSENGKRKQKQKGGQKEQQQEEESVPLAAVVGAVETDGRAMAKKRK